METGSKVTPIENSVTTDGRTARRDLNRLRVLDACIEIFTAGGLPTPEDVATLSGVSLRSVYRYFDDRDGLIRAAIDHQASKLADMTEIPSHGHGNLTERIAGICATRVNLFFQTGQMYRAARAAATGNPVIEQRLFENRDALHGQVLSHFATEVAAGYDVSMVDTLLSFDSLDYLQSALGKSKKEIITSLRHALHQLFDETEIS